MSKLGRYSAQRRKVESITAAKSLTTADCGSLLMLNLAAGFTVTLPSVADAGKGWWCRFIVATNCTSNDYIISEKAAADTNVIIGVVQEAETDDGQDGPSSTGCTFITIANGTDTVGDWVEINCDGTNFYATGQTVLDGGVAFT